MILPDWRPLGSSTLLGLTLLLGVHSVRSQSPSTAPREKRLPNEVGPATGERYLTPTGQVLTPAGKQVRLPGFRPQVLALSPDGKLLATSGKKSRLVLIDPATGNVLQEVPLPRASEPAGGREVKHEDETEEPEEPPTARNDSRAVLSLNGLAFAPDGRRIYLSTAGGEVKVFAVDKDREVRGIDAFKVPDAQAPKRRQEIPAGLAVSDNGQRLYVTGNLGNRLHEFEAASGEVLRSWDVGVAPFEVVLADGKAYVSNSGGRRPDAGSITAPAGRGTTVRVDALRHIANEGSVTVIDLRNDRVKSEILVGLHASAMVVSPNGRYVVVANTGSDTLSVLDTETDRVVEKIWARQSPSDLFGAQPNGLCFDKRGQTLFVANGTQNAVAVIRFDPADKESRIEGLIPVGWFPGAVRFDSDQDLLCVANIKGIGAFKDFGPEDQVKLRTKDFYGTLSLVPLPDREALAAMTVDAFYNMRYPMLKQALLPARPGQPARPVPERVGEPSVFQHVVYVIKENRTYDQVLGDMPEGDGDPELCTFGEKYTPNQHKLAREFVLLDNTYCSGVQSADGHQWTDSAIANAYMERQLTADFPRSYPGGKDVNTLDALAWSSSGFIWDNAMAHGKTFRNYGEWMISEAGWSDPNREGRPRWKDFWEDFQNNTGLTKIGSRPGIASMEGHCNLRTVGYDLRVPDVLRATAFIQELKEFEEKGGFPHFMILFLPNDHTGGTRGRDPTPGAQVADNDLALGMVVEALSHSKFWPETVLFAIEDDPQAGWDHVSGYRTTCYVASPYTKRGQTISTQYNQTSLMRTMELILGLPPMNHLDATATPMTDCFGMEPNLKPYSAVPNQVPLDQVNPEPRRVEHPVLRRDALMSERLPLDEMDKAPEDTFNRILWRAMKGPDIPYPEWAVTMVEDDDD